MTNKYYKRIITLKETGLTDFPEDIKSYINNINSLLDICDIGELKDFINPRYQIYNENTYEVLFETKFNSREEIDLIWVKEKNYDIVEKHHILLPYIINDFYNIINHHNILIDSYQTEYKETLGLFYK